MDNKKQKKSIDDINLRVIAREVQNVQKIICKVSYAVVAKYSNDCSMWSYLAYKGPLFLIEDKLNKKKLVLLNQCSTRQFILSAIENYRFELKDVKNGGLMLNYAIEDSIEGLVIKGIWSQDPALQQMFKILNQESMGNKGKQI